VVPYLFDQKVTTTEEGLGQMTSVKDNDQALLIIDTALGFERAKLSLIALFHLRDGIAEAIAKERKK
jgi:hypothetical protein